MTQMTKENYLFELRKRLRHLPTEEIENAVSYYREYVEDAGLNDGDAIIAELGTPEELASRIIAETAEKELNNTDAEPVVQPKKKSQISLWAIVLAVFAAPIALPMAFALFALVLALYITIFAFGIAGFALAIAGIAGLVGSIAGFFMAVPAGLCILGIGASFLLVSIGAAIVLGTAWLFKVSYKGIKGFAVKKILRGNNK